MWLDVRTAETVDRLKVQTEGRKAETLKALSGLPISTYFSALKLCWLIDNVPEVKIAIEQKRCLFGTVDTWLIWVSRHIILQMYRKFGTYNTIKWVSSLFLCVSFLLRKVYSALKIVNVSEMIVLSHYEI